MRNRVAQSGGSYSAFCCEPPVESRTHLSVRVSVYHSDHLQPRWSPQARVFPPRFRDVITAPCLPCVGSLVAVATGIPDLAAAPVRNTLVVAITPIMPVCFPFYTAQQHPPTGCCDPSLCTGGLRVQNGCPDGAFVILGFVEYCGVALQLCFPVSVWWAANSVLVLTTSVSPSAGCAAEHPLCPE